MMESLPKLKKMEAGSELFSTLSFLATRRVAQSEEEKELLHRFIQR